MEWAHLKDHPDLIAELARHCAREWAHLYEDWTEETASREFLATRTDGGLPATLIALEEGALAGTVSLIPNDLPGWEHLNPWLASLLVLPAWRNKGVGRFLIREAERFLATQNIPEVFLFTETAAPLFSRLGWRHVAWAEAQGRPVEIFCKSLVPAESTKRLP